jgi:phage-related protein
MPYSTFPLEGNFDNSTSYQVRKISNQFLEGGVDDRAQNGLNTITHTRNISINFEGYSKKLEVENFFRSLGGSKPFLFQPFLDTAESASLYTCKEFNFREYGNNVYNFSGTFERVFRLKP